MNATAAREPCLPVVPLAAGASRCQRVFFYPLALSHRAPPSAGCWFRYLSGRTGAWNHPHRVFDPKGPEERLDNPTALSIYEAERGIECGCCVAGCVTADMRADCVGAAFLNRIARFLIDSRDERPRLRFFEVVGPDEGVFGCLGLMASDDLCPTEIPLQGQLAFVRCRMPNSPSAAIEA